MGALKHFLATHGEAARCQKRGGDAPHLALDSEIPTADDATAFDREWALALLARALAALEAEHASKPELFQSLSPWLDGGSAAPQAETARALGLSETAMRVAIHRLRARFRELIRAEVAATVDDPAEEAAELRHLIAAAAHG